eukprot:2084798-Rhodomonas_salina.1
MDGKGGWRETQGWGGGGGRTGGVGGVLVNEVLRTDTCGDLHTVCDRDWHTVGTAKSTASNRHCSTVCTRSGPLRAFDFAAWWSAVRPLQNKGWTLCAQHSITTMS